MIKNIVEYQAKIDFAVGVSIDHNPHPEGSKDHEDYANALEQCFLESMTEEERDCVVSS